MPRTFLYRCPNTGQNVQGWSADEVTDDDETYQSFQCMACTRVHLVNLKTGKMLGEEEAEEGARLRAPCWHAPCQSNRTASGNGLRTRGSSR